jgi:hypothetical protein
MFCLLSGLMQKGGTKEEVLELMANNWDMIKDLKAQRSMQ